VVPVHNRWRYAEPFLSGVEQQTWSPLTTIVVDDGSTDGTSQFIQELFPHVVLLRGDGNLWWTGAVNMGIRWALERAATTDYVLLINDDLEVDPRFVERLVRFALRHPRALVGVPTVPIGGGDQIEDGGTVINWWTAKHRTLNRGRRLTQFAAGHFERVSYLTGRGVLIPVRAFRDAGLYDDAHFLQCGDTEFPIRAAKLGYQLLISYDCAVRSHVEEVAAVNRERAYTLGMWKEYFFGIKSNTRLKYRFYVARTGAGPNPIRFVTYLACDVARLLIHFVRRLAF